MNTTERSQRLRSMDSRPDGAGGFTLIELLVVISIIALLVGILLPVIKNAREAAFAAKCLTGVRQNAVAVTVYAQDHDTKYPEYKNVYPSIDSWDYALSTPSYEITRRETLGEYLNITEYVSGIGFVPGLTACPNTTTTLKYVYYYNEHLLGSDGHGSTPGTNRWGPSTPGIPTISVDQVTKPSVVFWNGDYQLGEWELYGHQEGRNLSFVDAHASHIQDEDRESELWGDLWVNKPLTWPNGSP